MHVFMRRTFCLLLWHFIRLPRIFATTRTTQPGSDFFDTLMFCVAVCRWKSRPHPPFPAISDPEQRTGPRRTSTSKFLRVRRGLVVFSPPPPRISIQCFCVVPSSSKCPPFSVKRTSLRMALKKHEYIRLYIVWCGLSTAQCSAPPKKHPQLECQGPRHYKTHSTVPQYMCVKTV